MSMTTYSDHGLLVVIAGCLERCRPHQRLHESESNRRIIIWAALCVLIVLQNALEAERTSFAALPWDEAVQDVLSGLTSEWLTEDQLAQTPQEPEDWQPQVRDPREGMYRTVALLSEQIVSP